MYKRINVSTYGTEWDFISNMILQIENCGIECLTDKEELKSAMESKTASVIPIVFQYLDFQFKFQRGAIYNQNVSYYNFYAIHNDTDLFTKQFSLNNKTSACDTITTRCISLVVLINNGHMELLVYDYNDSFCAEVFFTEIGGEVCYAYSDNENIPAVSGNLIAMDSKTAYTALNTMPFQHIEIEKLFYVSEKIFLNGNVYATSDNELLDCTAVTPKTLITINDKNYFALSANTLISV